MPEGLNPIIAAFLQARQLAQQQANMMMEKEQDKERLKVEKDRLKEQQRQFDESLKRTQEQFTANLDLAKATFNLQKQKAIQDVSTEARKEFATGTRRLQGMTGLPISQLKQGPAFEGVSQEIPREFTPFESQNIETAFGPLSFPTEEIATPDTIEAQIMRLRQKALPMLAAESYAKAAPQMDIAVLREKARAREATDRYAQQEYMEDIRQRNRERLANYRNSLKGSGVDPLMAMGISERASNAELGLTNLTSSKTDVLAAAEIRKKGYKSIPVADMNLATKMVTGVSSYVNKFESILEEHGKDIGTKAGTGTFITGTRIEWMGRMTELGTKIQEMDTMLGGIVQTIGGEPSGRISDQDVQRMKNTKFDPRIGVEGNTRRVAGLRQHAREVLRNYLRYLPPKQLAERIRDFNVPWLLTKADMDILGFSVQSPVKSTTSPVKSTTSPVKSLIPSVKPISSTIPTDEIKQKITSAASKHNVSSTLALALAQSESSFNPKAVGSKGDAGLYQLMPATAKAFGVKDPFDVDQNIEGAMKLLSYLNKRYKGDFKKIIAAYNAGEGAVDKDKIPSSTKLYVEKVIKIMVR